MGGIDNLVFAAFFTKRLVIEADGGEKAKGTGFTKEDLAAAK
ncbi:MULTISPECIES: hypothetical protein [Bacillus]|nr:hypothetical protein [Bacillus cereus]